jgi:hypothetical protein
MKIIVAILVILFSPACCSNDEYNKNNCKNNTQIKK